MAKMFWLLQGILGQGPGPGPFEGPWGWHYGMMGGGLGMFVMIIFMILFWGLIIGGIILLVRFIFPSVSPGMKSSQDAVQILKQRYARGEIEKEEFEAKKRDVLS